MRFTRPSDTVISRLQQASQKGQIRLWTVSLLSLIIELPPETADIEAGLHRANRHTQHLQGKDFDGCCKQSLTFWPRRPQDGTIIMRTDDFELTTYMRWALAVGAKSRAGAV